MHAIKGGWVGQTFAVSASNDSGGKKSRIRRSKGERKDMVESFIKKYQKTNDGNFPSLNLTHKEVGGSFYTVREIVREIIQENRVLAPPKFSLEEHDHSGFPEQHPLGTISMEPQSDLPMSDKVHILMHNGYHVTSEEHISSSTVQFHGPDTLQLDNGHIVNGLNKVSENGTHSDRTSLSHPASDHYEDARIEEVSQSSHQISKVEHTEFENEKIVNDGEGREVDRHSEEALTINTVLIHHQENNGTALLSSQEIHGGANQKLTEEKYLSENEYINDKTKELGQQTFKELVEASKPVLPNTNSNVVVETFPLRPVSSTIHDLDGESGKLYEADGTLKDKGLQHDTITLNQISSDLINQTDEKKVMGSTEEFNVGHRDEIVVLDLQKPASDNSELSTTSKNILLDADDGTAVEIKDSLPDETKVGYSKGQLINEESATVGTKSNHQDASSSLKASNPTLDRINLETWDGASKKSARPESNPLLAVVKAFITAFVKFWTE